MKKWKNICKGLKKQLRIKSNPIAKKKKNSYPNLLVDT